MDEVAPKKILLISPDFGFGGAERSIAKLSHLLARKYEIHFVVFNDSISSVYSFEGKLHLLHVGAGANFFGKALGFIKRVRRLKKIKKSINPSASISFLEGSDYINVLSKQNEKVIVSMRGSKRHDSNIQGVLGFLRNKILIPFIYRRADHIVSVAQGILNELQEDYHLPERISRSVIPNFYDIPELKKKASEPFDTNWNSFFDKHVVFLTVGRLAYEKGFHLLADVFAGVLQKHPDAKLVFVGSGDFEEEIQKRLQKNHVSFSTSVQDTDFNASVIFAGYQSNPLKWIARARFFVLSSFTEGFPNVVIESMAVGTPVIAANCPYGPLEILSEKTDTGVFRSYGMLLPLLSNDPNVLKQWENHFNLLIADESVYSRYANGPAQRVKEYGPEKAFERWTHLIEH